MRRGGLAILAITAACAGGVPERALAPNPDPAPEAAAVFLARASLLSDRGDPGAAAIYLEAALDAGADERIALPPLVACLVRAGELRRARSPLARLLEIDPGDPAAIRLDAAIALVLGGAERKEARR